MRFLVLCQITILTTIKAIPIGRKTPTLPLTALRIMRINPLIEKSIAEVLYDFEFLEALLSTMSLYLLYKNLYLVY